MLAADRHNQIISLLRQQGRVEVDELSRQFHVTQETIRRDLDKLSKDGVVRRTHGGALLQKDDAEIPYIARRRTNVQAKQHIAGLIGQQIENGSRIMLDASTTALFVAKNIRNKQDITLITNSIEILVELSDQKGWNILSTGGALKSGGLSLVGPAASQSLRDFHVDIAVCSCKGLDLQWGVSESNEADAAVKKEMLRCANRRILAADSSKFDFVSFTRVCGLAEVDLIVCEKKPSELWLSQPVEFLYPSDENAFANAP